MQPNTIRGWLDLVEAHLSTIAQNTTAINEALRAPLIDGPISPAQKTVGAMLASALYVPSSEASLDTYTGIGQLLLRQLGSLDDTPFGEYVRNTSASSERIRWISRILGAESEFTPSVTVYDNVSQSRFLLAELLANMQTADAPSPMRNAVQNIIEILSTSIPIAASNANAAEQSRTLLQQLLNCSPCSLSVPTAPSVCENTAGFLYTISWVEYVDPATDQVLYLGNLDGTAQIGDIVFGPFDVQPFINGPTVRGMRAVRPTEGTSGVGYCVEWAGNGQNNNLCYFLPVTTIQNGGVTINQPPPSSAYESEQVFGPSLAERSTYFVLVPQGPNGGAPPTTSRVFITPQMLA